MFSSGWGLPVGGHGDTVGHVPRGTLAARLRASGPVRSTAVQFRVLGPIEVLDGGSAVRLPGGKQRALLARLLVDLGRVVSVDTIAEALWGDEPPPTAAGTIQAHVSNLRRALGPATIATRSPGYLLTTDGHGFDHVELERTLRAARAARADGRAEEALEHARAATDLVRGEPYGDVAFEAWAQAEVRRLTDLVLASHEEVHAALLELGRHPEALPSLQALVEANPFHERLRAQLMLALYRDGRQADALRCYREGRERLVEELGVDPGPELQQMEARILAQDPGLGLTRPAPTPPMRTPTASTGGLHGRAATMAVLLDAWDRSRGGTSRTVLLEGRPGMGKSSVARALASQVRDDGGLVGVGAAHSLAGAPPFWPWIGALRDLAGRADEGLVQEAIASTPGGELLRPLLDEAAAPSSPGAQFPLFDAATRVLTSIARRQPVLVVLEDLHWADQATLDLLHFLAHAGTAEQVLVLVTHRPVQADHPLAATIAAVVTGPNVTSTTLDPLDVDAVTGLLEEQAGGVVDRDLAASIVHRTGGNPFYVRALAEVLRGGDGDLDPARTTVPDAVRATLHQRAAQLGPHGREVLDLCSTAGGDFSDVIPQDVLGLPEGELLAVLDAAIADGLVVEAPGHPGFYRFVHDIVRHAFYDALPQRRRAEMHVAIARAIEARTGGSHRWAWQLASHYSQGIDLGTAAEAVHWQRQAAAQAVRARAHADAVSHLRRAVYVARTRVRDPRIECETLIELAAAARLAADPSTAVPARAAAQRIAERLCDEALLRRSSDVLLAPGPHWVRRPR